MQNSFHTVKLFRNAQNNNHNNNNNGNHFFLKNEFLPTSALVTQARPSQPWMAC